MLPPIKMYTQLCLITLALSVLGLTILSFKYSHLIWQQRYSLYAVEIMQNKKKSDTDIFVLLFFVWTVGIKSLVSMRKHDGTVINIIETARKLKTKCLTLLPLHALTGCDTVSYPCGKGKATAITMLMKEDIHLEA